MEPSPPPRRLTLGDVIAALPLLTDAEREKIEAALRMLRPEVMADYHEAALVFGEIAELIERMYGGKPLPYGVFRKHRSFPKFAKGAEQFLWYVGRHFKTSDGAERVKVRRFLLRMLAARMAKESVPVGYFTMATHLQRVPEIVDLEFPGYRESGLLSRVVTARADA